MTDVYSSQSIWLPDSTGDNSQLVTIAQKEKLSLDGDSSMGNPSERAATISTNDGRRLYVGNIPYATAVEDLTGDSLCDSSGAYSQAIYSD